MQTYNRTIYKYESDGFKAIPTIDYSGWELKYMIKKSKTDRDIDALLSITPTFVTESGTVKIQVLFLPENLESISDGKYWHALKVISSDKTQAKFLLGGICTITSGGIDYPAEVA